MTKTRIFSTVELEFTDEISVIFNTKISKTVEGLDDSIISYHNTSSPSLTYPLLTFPDNRPDIPGHSEYGIITLHNNLYLLSNPFFFARVGEELGEEKEKELELESPRPLRAIHTNPDFKTGFSKGPVSILEYLQSTIGIHGGYKSSYGMPDGVKELEQTLLGVREVWSGIY